MEELLFLTPAFLLSRRPRLSCGQELKSVPAIQTIPAVHSPLLAMLCVFSPSIARVRYSRRPKFCYLPSTMRKQAWANKLCIDSPAPGLFHVSLLCLIIVLCHKLALLDSGQAMPTTPYCINKVLYTYHCIVVHALVNGHVKLRWFPVLFPFQFGTFRLLFTRGAPAVCQGGCSRH